MVWKRCVTFNDNSIDNESMNSDVVMTAFVESCIVAVTSRVLSQAIDAYLHGLLLYLQFLGQQEFAPCNRESLMLNNKHIQVV
jgi:hypothetical protein